MNNELTAGIPGPLSQFSPFMLRERQARRLRTVTIVRSSGHHPSSFYPLDMLVEPSNDGAWIRFGRQYQNGVGESSPREVFELTHVT